MRRILHLSDLHFGRPQPLALEALRRFIAEQSHSIDLIVSTGDWTQRAKSRQFQEAVSFIRSLPVKTLSVPGNHDVPLYDISRRLLIPFRKYHKYIKAVTVDCFRDAELSVIGLSTVNTLAVADGFLQKTEFDRTRDFFRQSRKGSVRVIACHHPIYESRSKEWIRPMDRAQHLLDLHPQIIMSGHNHISLVDQIDWRGKKIVVISAGTVVSSRLRGEANSLHLIDIDSDAVKVATWALSENAFVQTGSIVEKSLI